MNSIKLKNLAAVSELSTTRRPITLQAHFPWFEATLALAIAAFCLIAVFGLMPIGVQTNRNATSQTAAANIITAVVTDLQTMLFKRRRPDYCSGIRCPFNWPDAGLFLTLHHQQATYAIKDLNDAKADLLARGALAIVVSDLRQEIANGSTATTVNGITIYSPTAAANMLPRSKPTPTPATTPAIANLIRRSLRSEAALWPDTNAGPAVGSRASALNSTNPSDASANGRSISLPRWNSHYLVPKLNPGDDKSDPITTGFSAPNYWAPDWVFVTNNGPAVITAPSASILGRYAYAVYDEGGLIDVNVKGYPLPAPSPANYAQTIGRKGSGVFADLSQLANMSNTGINNLIGWRNYASQNLAVI